MLLLIRVLTIMLVLFASTSLMSQPAIKGRVTDAATGSGLANCNVFITNTGIGTVTDKDGHFTLQQVPRGNSQLVVSYVGFETRVYAINSDRLPLELTIQMKSRAKELENVVLEPYEDGDFKKWQYLFLSEFLGRTANANDCKIKNTEALRFRFYTVTRRLTAWSEEPLIIENDALGYIITYQLESFEVNTVKGTTFYLGYTLFREMETDRPKKKEKWIKNREQAYKGSQMHFMRSLYNNALAQEGFEVRRQFIVSNEEKKRVKQFYNPEVQQVFTPSGMGGSFSYTYKNEPKGLTKDSLTYYRRLVVSPDSIIQRSPWLLTGDSIILANEGESKVAFFGSQLYITHKNKTELRQAHSQNWSVVQVAEDKELRISANGMFHDARDMISSGKWSVEERVANLLPWDY